jgi:hypothetical protein
VATDFDYKAFRLLRAFYDLAEGNPGTPVRGIDAAHKADIDYSWQEYTTLVAHLKDMEWLDNMNIVGDEMLRITPTGVREVEGGRPPNVSGLARPTRCCAPPKSPYTPTSEQASLGVMYRVTVREAAHRLGVTPDAIRQRIKRGTIEHDKGEEDGLTYVYLTPSENVSEAPSEGVTEALLRTYEDQIQFLRAELERKDAILMSLTQRIPELEAPPETRESPETTSETTGSRVVVREEPRETISRPWWRRMFGG